MFMFFFIGCLILIIIWTTIFAWFVTTYPTERELKREARNKKQNKDN